MLEAVLRLPANALVALIRFYQRAVSPSLPAFFGPSYGCRFAPTCSDYAAQAVRSHGAGLGLVFALRRFLKCTPLHPGGLDPVPPARRVAPRCVRIAS